MEWHIVYAKFDGCKGFKAFDVNEGRQVGNLIYASLVENTEDTRTKLHGQTNHLPTFFRPAVNGRTVPVSIQQAAQERVLHR